MRFKIEVVEHFLRLTRHYQLITFYLFLFFEIFEFLVKELVELLRPEDREHLPKVLPGG